MYYSSRVLKVVQKFSIYEEWASYLLKFLDHSIMMNNDDEGDDELVFVISRIQSIEKFSPL